MPLALRRFTVAELESFPDDGNRYELLDGVLFVTPSLGLPHQAVAARLTAELVVFLRQEPGIQVWAPGVVIVLPDLQLEPDVLVGRLPPTGDRWEDVSERWLAVEVSGTGSRIYDREYKRNAYLALGVREVWLVDLQTQRIFVSGPGAEQDRPYDVEVVWTSPGRGRELRVDVPELFHGVRRGE